jgi:hypothetical protein
MSHPSRRLSASMSTYSWLFSFAARWRAWWFAGRACAACVERVPRRREVFRPLVNRLEDRLAAGTLFGFLFPEPLAEDRLNLGNLGGGAGAARGNGRGTGR